MAMAMATWATLGIPISICQGKKLGEALLPDLGPNLTKLLAGHLRPLEEVLLLGNVE